MSKVCVIIEDVPKSDHVSVKLIKEPQDPLVKRTYAEQVGEEVFKAIQEIIGEAGGKAYVQ